MKQQIQQLIKLNSRKEQQLRMEVAKLDNDIASLHQQIKKQEQLITQSQIKILEFKNDLYDNKYRSLIQCQKIYEYQFLLKKMTREETELHQNKANLGEEILGIDKKKQNLLLQIKQYIIKIEKYKLITMEINKVKAA